MKTVEGDGNGAVVAAARDAATAGYRALVSGCALGPPPAASWIELSGADRARFLHGQTTCDVTGLVAGRGVYGFLVSAKGRVLADVVISAAADRLRVELPAGSAAGTIERFRRYVVADRVEMKEREGDRALLVAGPEAAAALAPLCPNGTPPEAWDHLEVHGGELSLRGELRLGVPAWRLGGSAERLEETAAVLRRAGAVAASAAERETVRVERGLPRAGIDFDERHFPQETGLEEWAVSYTKGCYIGQEVVARIHYRGRVNHVLRGVLSAAGMAAPELGPLTDEDGETAGELTSVVFSPAVGRAVGLTILHRRRAETGTRLKAPGGAEVEVVELPFAAPRPAEVEPSESPS